MSDKTLIQKLLIKPNFQIALMNAPEDYVQQLGDLPEGIRIIAEPQAEQELDFIQVFVKNKADIDSLSPIAISALKHDGLLWLSYPKGSSKVETDINRDRGWDTVNSAGFRPVTQISIDDIWSALRFRPKK